MRVGLGLTQGFPYSLTEGEWLSLFKMAKVQTVQGVAFDALSWLPPESRPPRALYMRLSLAVEAIRGMNRRMDEVASRYTQMFAERGFRSVVLKGRANARLYPEPLSRQSGDIDIWVPGGYDKVERLLLDMGLISEGRDSYRVSHHIGFRDASGIEIEVHHRLLFAERAFRAADAAGAPVLPLRARGRGAAALYGLLRAAHAFHGGRPRVRAGVGAAVRPGACLRGGDVGAGGGFWAFAGFDDLPARQASRHAAVQGDVRRRELRACPQKGEASAAGAVVWQQGKVAQLDRVRPAQHRAARSPLLARHHLAHPRTHQAKESVFVGGRGGASPLPTPLTKNANREKFLEKLFLGIDNRPAFVYI